MAQVRDKFVVALLAVPESSGSTLYGMYDILEAAADSAYQGAIMSGAKRSANCIRLKPGR